jgi:hypothetical protein
MINDPTVKIAFFVTAGDEVQQQQVFMDIDANLTALAFHKFTTPDD